MRVLLVEDSSRVADVVVGTLSAAGHQVVVQTTLVGGKAALDSGRFELAILDIGLPDGSGLDLCLSARHDGHDLPILLLTARNGLDDRVSGLDAGADDYLGKPFAPAELAARVRALGRRGPRWTESVLTFGPVRIDRDRRTVTRGDVRVPLTPREFDVVALLAWRRGRVVERDEILEVVWGDTTEGAAASLDVLVARIRRKLDAGETRCLRTVRQMGYAWELPLSRDA